MMWAITEGITTHVDMAKQNMTLAAEVASHEKPEAPASACLTRPKEHPEQLLNRNLFLHSTGSFYTKGRCIKTVFGYIIHTILFAS